MVKRLSKHAVYLAKSQAKQEILKDLSPGSTDLFRLANQMGRENLDVQGEKPVRNDAGVLAWMTGPSKLRGKNARSASRM